MTDLPIMKRPIVYLAGPITLPAPWPNMLEALKIANQIWADGIVVPHVPQLTVLWDSLHPRKPEEWYEYDFPFLARMDALLRLPGHSVGADGEVEFAHEHGIPVFDRLWELYEWAAEWRGSREVEITQFGDTEPQYIRVYE